MKTKPRYIFAVAFVGIVIFQYGCESTDYAVARAGLNAQEEQQFRKAQTKTRVGGTTVGALVGAGLGYAIGGSWESAVAGAVAGGAAGAVAGENKARKQGQILVTERQLDSLISSTASANQRLRGQISQLSSQRKTYQQRISSAKAAGNSKALASIRQEIKSSLNSADSSIATASKTVNYNGTVAGESAAKQSLLRSETSKLDTSAKELQNERRLMASLYNSIDV